MDPKKDGGGGQDSGFIPHDQVVKVGEGWTQIWTQCSSSIAGLPNEQLSYWLKSFFRMLEMAVFQMVRIKPENTKGGSIILPLTSRLTGLD